MMSRPACISETLVGLVLKNTSGVAPRPTISRPAITSNGLAARYQVPCEGKEACWPQLRTMGSVAPEAEIVDVDAGINQRGLAITLMQIGDRRVFAERDRIEIVVTVKPRPATRWCSPRPVENTGCSGVASVLMSAPDIDNTWPCP